MDHMPEVRRVENNKRQTVRDILDLVSGNVPLGVDEEFDERERDFAEKLQSEAEDEYNFSWGTFENGELNLLLFLRHLAPKLSRNVVEEFFEVMMNFSRK